MFHRRARSWSSLGSIAGWLVIGLILLITFFPFLWVVRTALTNPDAIFTNTSSLLPVDPTICNFERVLGLVDTTAVVQQATNVSAGVLNFWLYLRNTIIVAGSITIGQSLSVRWRLMLSLAFTFLSVIDYSSST